VASRGVFEFRWRLIFRNGVCDGGKESAVLNHLAAAAVSGNGIAGPLARIVAALAGVVGALAVIVGSGIVIVGRYLPHSERGS